MQSPGPRRTASCSRPGVSSVLVELARGPIIRCLERSSRPDWRKIPLLASIVAALLFVPAGIASSSPPVIREPWTNPLSCPKRPPSTLTTSQIVACLERAVLRSDRRINAKVATIFRLLGTRSDRARFVGGERAWLRYRRQSCRTLASKFGGGSAAPVAFLSCQKRLNAQHLVDLREVERTLRQR